ncbi:MAG: carboxypeptidase regulatory-like domain-containing protein [Bryobacteraceae bacterium]
MRTRLLLLLFSTYAFFAVKAPCQPAPNPSQSRGNGYSVTGIVLQRGSNQPLKHAQVSLTSVEHRNRQLFYITPDNGQFVFSGLTPGKYSLEAQLHGFTQAFRGNEDYSTAIVVGPALDSEHVRFLLDIPAAISGTVVDQEGDPVRDAQVFLFHSGIFSGRTRTIMQMQAGTDSSGMFHFGHLRSGTYFVAVSARPWYAPNSPLQGQSENSGPNANAPELDVAYPVTYYPDALDPAAASPITLSQGAVAELSIALRAMPALRLEVNASAQQNLNLGISAVGPGASPLPINAAQFAEENRRGLLGLAPGHYVVTLQRFDQRSGSLRSGGTKAIDLTANSTLDVNDLPNTAISGKVMMEGSEHPRGLTVGLVNVNSGQATGGSVAPDGSFKVERGSISPGQYEIRLGNTPELYIKSIAVTGAEYSNAMVNVAEGASIQISIVAAKGLTHVNGIAIKDDKPFPGAMVLLVPQNANRGEYLPRDQSDSDGTFTLNFAAPGQYALIAIDNGRDLAYRDASVIKPYLEQAQAIDVPLQRDASLKVTVQHRRP